MTKYKFRATFKDGEIINESDDGVSSVDKKKSSFHDVKLKGVEDVIRFELLQEGRVIVSVNLLSGKFTIKNVNFYVNCDFVLNGKLVFFRRHYRVISSDPEVEEKHQIYHVVGIEKEGKLTHIMIE